MTRRACCGFGGVGRAAAAATALSVIAGILIIPGCGDDEEDSKPRGYFEGLAGAKDMAEEKACQAQLAGLRQALAMYATTNEGQFPASLEKLVESRAAPSELLTCPRRGKQAYVYLPGQNQKMPAGNILVFEEDAVHRGRCNVLRLGGTVEALTSEQVSAERAKTEAAIRSAGGS